MEGLIFGILRYVNPYSFMSDRFSPVDMSAEVSPKLYCAWFCPFAQRAWIALLAKGTEFEYIEQDPYNKTPEWLAVNPRGMVPVIVHNNKSIYESSVCIEYVDEAWPSEPRLLPEDPYERAHARIWGDFISKKIVPLFYALLMKQGKDEQEEIKPQLTSHFLTFTKAMHPTGPFFQGEKLLYVDIMLAPYAARFNILKHYRGFELLQSNEFERFHKWWEAVKNDPAVKNTLQDDEKLIASYKRYADGSAKSQVGDAIRKGGPMP